MPFVNCLAAFQWLIVHYAKSALGLGCFDEAQQVDSAVQPD